MRRFFVMTALCLLTLTAMAVEKEYTLFSAGMPNDAVIKIGDKEYRGVNAQGDTKFMSEELGVSDVAVVVGHGYGYWVSVDNANHQVNVDFTLLFQPTASKDAEQKNLYVLKMPQAYVKVEKTNIVHTTKKGEADRFIFLEDADEVGCYYIYDTTAKRYVYYDSDKEGSSVKSQSESHVKLALSTMTMKGKTWRVVLRKDRETVSIIPRSQKQVTDDTPAWNFTGGIAQGCVLNLWRASDSNSAWSIIDPSVASLACATMMFATPGQEYMHKLIPFEGETIEDVDFGNLTSLALKSDRIGVGHKYKYVYGKAPVEEGVYSYAVKVRAADGDVSTATISLTVSRQLQSPTPMMGWLTWNWFARAISHDKMVNIAKGMEARGLIEAGYNTIVLDDAWATNQRDKAKLTYDSQKFPKGISGLITALRNINGKLKVGIYSDAGSMTCENYQPGSFGYEEQHVALFDSWGVDMLKYDFCNSESSAYASYKAMGKAVSALNARRKEEGRPPFVFNICEWGSNQPWTWGAEAGGSSWRSTNDARESWIGTAGRPGVLGGADINRDLWMYAGVNRYNDLDMMAIGLHGLGGPSNNTSDHMSNGGVIAGLTDEQARTQMSLWSMMASPLALTCDLRPNPAAEANGSAGKLPSPLITDADVATLTNADIIAINQDVLGQQAEYMEALSTGTKDFQTTGYDVYVKDLANGRKAVSVTNRATTAMGSISLQLADLYMDATASYTCKEVWSGKTTSVSGTLTTGSLKPCETKVFILSAETTMISPVSQNTVREDSLYDMAGRVVKTPAAGHVYLKKGKAFKSK